MGRCFGAVPLVVFGLVVAIGPSECLVSSAAVFRHNSTAAIVASLTQPRHRRNCAVQAAPAPAASPGGNQRRGAALAVVADGGSADAFDFGRAY